MDSKSISHPPPYEMFFLPFFAPAHMVPLVEIARLFAARGANITIITTPLNAPLISKSIDKDTQSGSKFTLHILPFPYQQAGLPEGVENFYKATTVDLASKLYYALTFLQKPIEDFFRNARPKPDCIVSDMFYPWTADIASEIGIPRLIYHAACLFALSLKISIKQYAPHETVESDSETFVVPGLPDLITMTRSQLPDYVREKDNGYGAFVQQMRDSELRSFGAVVNGFYELEPSYTQHYESLGTQAWHIGPVSLMHGDNGEKASRGGNEIAIDERECITWLDSKEPNSVLYICFGSACRFPATQMIEIAAAIESSGQDFIWVVLGKQEDKEEEAEKWLPEGFEERMKERKKGMIIRGWAPQVLILDHPATGGFMTHCGWNSTLESVSSGVAMITWPLYAEQFYNEKFVTQVLKIGVAVGIEEWNLWVDAGKVVKKREQIEKAIVYLMGGGEGGEEMKRRAKEFGEMAKGAVKAGGSSCSNLTSLIEELHAFKMEKSNVTAEPEMPQAELDNKYD